MIVWMPSRADNINAMAGAKKAQARGHYGAGDVMDRKSATQQ